MQAFTSTGCHFSVTLRGVQGVISGFTPHIPAKSAACILLGETASYTTHTRRFQCVNLFASVYLSRACRPPCVCMGISLSFYMWACVCVWTYICVFLVCSDGSQQFPVYLASWFPVRVCNKWSLAGLMSPRLAEWVFGSAKHSIMAWCCYHIPHKHTHT